MTQFIEQSPTAVKLLLITVLVSIILIEAKFLLVPICFGMLLAILLDPMVCWLLKYLKYHVLVYILTTFVFCTVLIVPFYAVLNWVIKIFSENSEIEDISQIKDAEFIQSALSDSRFSELSNLINIQDITSSVFSQFQGVLNFLVLDTVSTFVNIGLTLIFSYFFHAYYRGARKKVLKNNGNELKARLNGLADKIPTAIRSYVGGTLLVVLIITTLTSILLLLVGLEYALLWGLIVGMLTIIPFVGSALGILLPISYAIMMSHSLRDVIIIVIGYIVIQQIEGNLITPKVVGDQVGVNPLIVIVTMLVMGSFWGVAGVLISIPLAAVLRIFSEEFGDPVWAEIVFSSKK